MEALATRRLGVETYSESGAVGVFVGATFYLFSASQIWGDNDQPSTSGTALESYPPPLVNVGAVAPTSINGSNGVLVPATVRSTAAKARLNKAQHQEQLLPSSGVCQRLSPGGDGVGTVANAMFSEDLLANNGHYQTSLISQQQSDFPLIQLNPMHSSTCGGQEAKNSTSDQASFDFISNNLSSRHHQQHYHSVPGASQQQQGDTSFVSWPASTCGGTYD